MSDWELILLALLGTLAVVFILLAGGGGGPSKSYYDSEQAYLEQKSFHNAVMDQMRYNSLPDTHGIEELGQSIGGMTNEVGNLIDCFTD